MSWGTGRSQMASQHAFSMVPSAKIARSSFNRSHTHKTAFDSGYLVPIYWDEVLPGDTASVKLHSFARLSTPTVPFMDGLKIAYFFFYVPNRLLWTNWEKFNGAQDNPGDSTSYTVPISTCPASGYTVGSLHDYFGLPTVGQVTGGATYTHVNLYLRAYNQIWNAWFRDENLQNSVTKDVGDGPDTYSNYVLLKRGKRHDYFTSCLPWPQKGTAVSLPLGTTAPVVTTSTDIYWKTSSSSSDRTLNTLTGEGNKIYAKNYNGSNDDELQFGSVTGLQADLTNATAATINQLRQAAVYQQLLERDARGGTRYTEIVLSHFGVVSPDARLQRPEYLGGGVSNINVNPVAQTSGTSASGTTTPLGNMAAFGTHAQSGIGFRKSFSEHGVIIGLACVYADLTYQQGLNRAWSRSTRYDYYWPTLNGMGEQSVLRKEIYLTDGSTNDATVFGYQERYAEYRYKDSQITGKLRSTASGTLDVWHLAQKFTSAPTLNDTFIKETPPVDRVVAVTTEPQIIFDGFFESIWARPMPLYGS